MDKFSITIGNLHCEDCSKALKAALSGLFNIDGDVADATKPSVSIELAGNELTLISASKVLANNEKRVLKALEDVGLDVVWSRLDSVDRTHMTKSRWWDITNRLFTYKRNKRHTGYCSACANEKKDEDETLAEVPVVTAPDLREYRVLLTIGGMTCSSCIESISMAIETVLKSHAIPVQDENKDKVYTVSVVNNTAVVVLPNKQLVNNIINEIRDVGFQCSLCEVVPLEKSTKFKVNAAIGGMTCAACSASISQATDQLPFVLESAVNPVSKSGVFILDDGNQTTIDTLKETVEDAGYDFELVQVSKTSHATSQTRSRLVNLKITGMFCDHCPENVDRVLNKYGDSIVIDNDISLNHPYVKFTYNPSPPDLTIRTIMKELTDISPQFKVEIVKLVTLDERVRAMARHEVVRIAQRLGVATVFAIPTFILGVVGMSLLPAHHPFRMWLMHPVWKGNAARVEWGLFILASPVYFIAASNFHAKSFMELRALWRSSVSWKRRIFKFGSMNLLVTLGTSVAYFASIAQLALAASTQRGGEGYSSNYFDAVVFLTFFLLIGRLLEVISKSRTASAITELGSLKPQTARLAHSDCQVSTDFLELGDLVKVVPGESPPFDCVIVEGSSDFDESALTGESTPVKHELGDQIYAGTVNSGSRTVVGKVLALDGSSMIDQIINTVRDGQLRRAPIERFADTLTGYFVPTITLLAVVTWFVWLGLGISGKLPPSYLDIDVGGWVVWSLQFAIAVFVVACPCGIGLAAPTALFVGSGVAAQNGILARGGGCAFQEGSRVNIVCFDKTGTLTMGGEPKVTDYSFLSSKVPHHLLLQLCRDLESSSRHPLSIAVSTFVSELSTKKQFTLSPTSICSVEEVPGRGLRGTIHSTDDYDQVIIGNEKMLQENDSLPLSPAQVEMITQWKAAGKSIVILAVKLSEKFVPVFAMGARDEIRPEAKSVISSLQSQGITCWMISGDNEITAKTIANEVGIDSSNVVAEVLPEEKANKIKWLQSGEKSIVAMVGDGINDSPALAVADVGIALASGSELAFTSSDFVLLAPSYPLKSLLTLFSLSRKIFWRVRFNFAWALIYNCIGIPIAAGVIYPYHNSRLNPVWASAAMAASSISVVMSSLALRLFKAPKVSLQRDELSQEVKEHFC